MAKRVRRAVFPVAGLGTRFLPVTKAMPKEMLPVVDKPLIQYAFEEATAAGIEECYFGTGRNMVAVMEIPREETRRYGILDVVEDHGKLVRAKGVVEKPEPAVAPSTLMIIGRYIIQPEIFRHLGDARAGAGGEIQLTDGLDKLISDGQPFHGLRAAARRYDCGEKLGYLEANLALGLQHPEFGDALRKLMKTYL